MIKTPVGLSNLKSSSFQSAEFRGGAIQTAAVAVDMLVRILVSLDMEAKDAVKYLTKVSGITEDEIHEMVESVKKSYVEHELDAGKMSAFDILLSILLKTVDKCELKKEERKPKGIIH